jgi:Tn3 transposase DDE domain
VLFKDSRDVETVGTATCALPANRNCAYSAIIINFSATPFRELGRVVRTRFLLEYISNRPMRERITAVTNIAESYHKYSRWFSFGGELLTSPDPEEQQKAVKYNDLLANAAILQNAMDLTTILRQLQADGHDVRKEDVAFLSPYLTGHIKRFGDYEPNVKPIREPTSEELSLTF